MPGIREPPSDRAGRALIDRHVSPVEVFEQGQVFLVAGASGTLPAVVVNPITSSSGQDSAISSAMASSTPGSYR